MKSYFALEPADLAEHYVASKGSPMFLPNTAFALVHDVERYLRANNLDHRLEDAIQIAQAAFDLAQEALALMPDPEQFQAEVHEGTTATDAQLAQTVAAMDLNAYAANREQLTGQRGNMAFLAGL